MLILVLFVCWTDFHQITWLPVYTTGAAIAALLSVDAMERYRETLRASREATNYGETRQRLLVWQFLLGRIAWIDLLLTAIALTLTGVTWLRDLPMPIPWLTCGLSVLLGEVMARLKRLPDLLLPAKGRWARRLLALVAVGGLIAAAIPAYGPDMLFHHYHRSASPAVVWLGLICSLPYWYTAWRYLSELRPLPLAAAPPDNGG